MHCWRQVRHLRGYRTATTDRSKGEARDAGVVALSYEGGVCRTATWRMGRTVSAKETASGRLERSELVAPEVAAPLDEFLGPNAGYVVELLERYQTDPDGLDPVVREQIAHWQAAGGTCGGAYAAPSPPAFASSPNAVSLAARSAALAQAIRFYGHLGAHLDPLGTPPPGDPQLELATYNLTEGDLAALPAEVVGGPIGRSSHTALEAVRRLREVYCTAIGYEFGHVQDPEERAWLLQAVEDGRFRPPAEPIDERGLLDRLTEVSALERFLQRAYPGQTRFSIEGLGMFIPMLDEMIARVAATDTRSILLGMAHRGRLNVLAHVLGKPYARILAEFEGRVLTRPSAPSETTDEGWTGDVKYHAGGQRSYRSGTVAVRLAPNPSHLEAVDPVVLGMARAADEDRHCPGLPCQDEVASVAVLIHGDAAFAAQGVVAESLNLSRLAAYRTGGTIHLIENNQLGFTTAPSEGRSTLYASDLAKGFEIPIVHVNADDPTACVAAVRLAVAYRARFRKDVLLDVIGYRRWGHNEGDEPSFTQPLLYERIARQPTVRERYAADLERRGAIQPGEAQRLLEARLAELQRIREEVLAQATEAPATAEPPTDGRVDAPPRPRRSSIDELRTLHEALSTLPDGFRPNPKLARALQRRRASFERDDAPVDWGYAESLAFATILRDGTPIRLTGQDTVRGTFSQRHVSFYDARTGAPYTPLQALPGARASFEIANSPLSENAALGFEYGYSVQAGDALVLWEAQYGDFINGAQVVVDEFLASGEAKWGLVSGLVLLLPHAWEGQGPDHSGGRLERFLQLAAENNLLVTNCTTSAQYFHLLRRQAASLGHRPRPLVLMTPKSLLRHPLAASPVGDLAEGAFQPVLDDPRASGNPEAVRRLVLCSGHVWAEAEGGPDPARDPELALVRIEELYPFPESEVRDLLWRYRRAEEVVWLQEEPQNMGAWTYVEPHLHELLGTTHRLRYVGRPAMASPAEGWTRAHAAEQRRIVEAIREGAKSHVG